jgi:hypothetical protein
MRPGRFRSWKAPISVLALVFEERYEGSGVWYDEAGKSQTYTVVQTNTATSDGFEVAFKHDFADGAPAG